MEHLGYRILPLCEEGIIEDAIQDMKRAGLVAVREREIQDARATAPKLEIAGHSRSISVPVRPGAGEAVLGLGFSLTPVDTPTEEVSRELGAPQYAIHT